MSCQVARRLSAPSSAAGNGMKATGQQTDQVQPQQRAVIPLDEAEVPVMGDPELPHDQEAHHERQDRRPEREDLRRQAVAGFGQSSLGRQRQDEQREDDRGHRVAEEHHPLEAERGVLALVGLLRGRPRRPGLSDAHLRRPASCTRRAPPTWPTTGMLPADTAPWSGDGSGDGVTKTAGQRSPLIAAVRWDQPSGSATSSSRWCSSRRGLSKKDCQSCTRSRSAHRRAVNPLPSSS